MTSDRAITNALAPLRAALRAAAAADVDGLLAGAEADATEQIAAALARAETIVAQARAEGAADAAVVLAGPRARARREARAITMRAQRDAYRSLREASRAAARRHVDQPGHLKVRERLATAARARLGSGPVTTREMVTEAAGRRIDCSLDGFADRAVDALGSKVEGLWRDERGSGSTG